MFNFPWQIKEDFSRCGNGSQIDAIIDAKGEVVVTSYNRTSYDALWELYLILTPEQEEALSNGRINDGRSRQDDLQGENEW